ncbi:MAG: hypothetical protein JRD43_03040 [Deltaproteobacteria bacterium]|nr:hypothetical protein [Deltaproteobacteria bacterium]MBW2595502.1 hypothetical protein [Deltaproteobacteria bacterium]MBW2649673.1 hypothetical protein [Deltaproteobacteria bacterium]
MKVLIGGAVAAVLGLIGLGIWWEEFFELLAGGIPIVLLLGGALAIYVGFDEMKDQMKSKEEETASTVDLDAAKEELQKAKAEAEKYKAELEKAKAADKAAPEKTKTPKKK